MLATLSAEMKIREKLDQLGCAAGTFCLIAQVGRNKLLDALNGGRAFDSNEADRLLEVLEQMDSMRISRYLPVDWSDAASIRAQLQARKAIQEMSRLENDKIRRMLGIL
jgi:hypothetical protein